MLLLTRKLYSDAIRNGSKRFEIRCGSRYRNVAAGQDLSINGQFRVRVTRVDEYGAQGEICAAMPDWAHAIRECYPDAPGPYYVFHFNPPANGARR